MRVYVLSKYLKKKLGRLRLQEEKGVTKDEMVQWHHQLKEHEIEQTPGDSEGQGSLACCSPWGSKRIRHDLATEQQQRIQQGSKSEDESDQFL